MLSFSMRRLAALSHKPSDYIDNTYLDALVKSGFVAKYVPGYRPPAAG